MSFVCTPEDMHPYNCTWDKYCIHCTNGETEYHNPNECWLCCDGDPKTHKPHRLESKPYSKRVRVLDFSHRYQKIKVSKFRQQPLPF